MKKKYFFKDIKNLASWNEANKWYSISFWHATLNIILNVFNIKTFTHCYFVHIGDDCELDEDACAESPCVHGRTCIDLTATEELRLGRGYNCSDCPTGYADIDNKCQGI